MFNQILRYFRIFVVTILVLLLLPALVSRLAASDPLATFVGLVLVSVGAYFVRERRRRRVQPPRPGAAERTPVLPRGKGEE